MGEAKTDQENRRLISVRHNYHAVFCSVGCLGDLLMKILVAQGMLFELGGKKYSGPE